MRRAGRTGQQGMVPIMSMLRLSLPQQSKNLEKQVKSVKLAMLFSAAFPVQAHGIRRDSVVPGAASLFRDFSGPVVGYGCSTLPL